LVLSSIKKGKVQMQKLFCLMLLCAALGTSASAQELDLAQAAVKDEAALARAMPELAKQVIALYKEPDRSRYLNALFRLQIVARQYTEAVATLQSLAEMRRATDPASALALLPFEMVAKAKAKQAATGVALNEAFKQEFRKVFEHLDDKSASKALYWFGGDLSRARDDLRAAVERQKGKDKIALTDALNLIRRYHFYQDIQVWRPLTSVHLVFITTPEQQLAAWRQADMNQAYSIVCGARIVVKRR
jgi:uncharacterized protein